MEQDRSALGRKAAAAGGTPDGGSREHVQERLRSFRASIRLCIIEAGYVAQVCRRAPEETSGGRFEGKPATDTKG